MQSQVVFTSAKADASDEKKGIALETLAEAKHDAPQQARKSRLPLADNDISHIADSELVALDATKKAPVISWTEEKKVLRISKRLVMKCGTGVMESEAKCLQLARRRLGIHVPRVYRAFTVDDEKSPFGTYGYIVMDYIKGETLKDNWIFFPKGYKEDIVHDVAKAVMRMHTLSLEPPGPIGGGPCRGRLFTKPGTGPFQTISEMEAWFDEKLAVSKQFYTCPQSLPHFKFERFVLVHQNLTSDNIWLDHDGNVWFLGWSNAGAYPPAFERAALALMEDGEEYKKAMFELLPEYKTQEQQLRALEFSLHAASYD